MCRFLLDSFRQQAYLKPRVLIGPQQSQLTPTALEEELIWTICKYMNASTPAIGDGALIATQPVPCAQHPSDTHRCPCPAPVLWTVSRTALLGPLTPLYPAAAVVRPQALGVLHQRRRWRPQVPALLQVVSVWRGGHPALAYPQIHQLIKHEVQGLQGEGHTRRFSRGRRAPQK